MTTTSEAVAEFEAQGAIAPGTEGWWKVWGASVRDVEVGDLVTWLGEPEDGSDVRPQRWLLVAGETHFDDIRAGLCRALHGLDEGERFTLGKLLPVVVLRHSTRNLLSRFAV